MQTPLHDVRIMQQPPLVLRQRNYD